MEDITCSVCYKMFDLVANIPKVLICEQNHGKIICNSCIFVSFVFVPFHICKGKKMLIFFCFRQNRELRGEPCLNCRDKLFVQRYVKEILPTCQYTLNTVFTFIKKLNEIGNHLIMIFICLTFDFEYTNITNDIFLTGSDAERNRLCCQCGYCVRPRH